MYAEIAQRIKDVVDGLKPTLGIRTTGFWESSAIEGLAASTGDLPLVLVAFAGSEPGARISTGYVRTERLSFSLIVAASDWRSFGDAQKGASDILKGLRDAFNPRTEQVVGQRVFFTFQGIEIIGSELPVLLYALNLQAETL
jgi:hypothetical protein